MFTIGFATAVLLAPNPAIEIPVGDANTVLRNLGQMLNISMKANGSVAEDFIVVRFTGSNPDKIRDRLAEALNATWHKQGDTFYLDRSPTQEEEISQIDTKPLEAAISHYLLDCPRTIKWSKADAVDFLRPFTSQRGIDTSASTKAMDTKGPYRAFLDDFINAIGVKTLISLPTGPPTEFAWNRSGQSLAIPTTLRRTATETQSNLNALAEAYREAGAAPPPNFFPKNLDSTQWKIEVQNRGFSLSFELRSAAGANLVFNRLMITRAPLPAVSTVLPRTDTRYTPTDLGRTLIEALSVTSPLTSNWLVAKGSSNHDLIDWFENGFPVDPLQLIIGEALTQEARSAGCDLVGVIDDGMIWRATRKYGHWSSLADVLNALISKDSVKFDEAGQFISIRHIPSEKAMQRFSRPGAASFAIAAKEDGWQRLVPLSKLATQCSGSEALRNAVRLAEVLQPVKSDLRIIDDSRFDLLQFVGSLSNAQIRLAETKGLSVRTSDLPRAAQDKLRAACGVKTFTKQAANAQAWPSGEQCDYPPPSGNEIALTPDTVVSVRIRSGKLFIPAENNTGTGFMMHPLMTPDVAATQVYKSRQSDATPLQQEAYRYLALVDADQLSVDLLVPGGSNFHSGVILDSRGPTTKYLPADEGGTPEREELINDLKKLIGGI